MRWTIFWKNEQGGIAIMFGVTLVVLATVVGAAVDYSRATNLRTAYQVAADAAVLAAVADPRLEFPERERIAHRVAAANLEKLNVGVNVLVKAHELPSGGVRVDIEGSSVSTIMAAVGIKATPVRASADAYALLENVEIALVLDLTGSMENDMPTLRRSAEALVRTLLENRSSQTVRISIVPFVAAVNPGRANLPMWMMDSGVNSQHHGRFLRNRATFIWRSGYPTCQPGGAFQDNTGGGSFNDRSSLELFNRSFSSLVHEVFGIAPAHAQPGQITPRSSQPYEGTILEGDGALLPHGFLVWSFCYMQNPPRISHFDLFSRIPNADWKGCVEARPEPFDVDVTPPSPGRPNTLFVPYFWPDETSALVQGRAHHNNYLPDGPLPPGWTYTHTSGRVHAYATTYSLFKYDSVTPAIILESPPSTLGPNKACPDEIMPLTTNMDALVGKIRSLSHWHGGGTIGSEGLMWGWRTLHPELPFDQGVAYGSARKILIFFTDGKNTINANGPGGPVSSDYSAYGHLTSSRFGVSTFSALEEKLDERMRRACTNIKAAGIEVYSVIFREQSGTARDLVRECASGVENHFLAVNEAELLSAFENIANSISSQRIAR